jgi:streptogramin lyase
VRIVVAIVLAGALVPLALGGASKVPPPPVEQAVVRTGEAPCGIAAHRGTVWVAVYEAGSLLALDATGRVTRRVRVGRSACGVVVAGDAVWVARDTARRLVRVDARTGRRRSFPVEGEAFDVLVAGGSLWVASHTSGTVLRLDPRSGRVLARVAVDPRPAGLAWCGRRVWVGHGGDATQVTSIDPRTSSLRRVETVVESPFLPSCIGGNLWVGGPSGIVRVDARSGRLLSALPLDGTFADAAAAPDGTVWVTDKEHSVVLRFTPDGRHELDRFRAGPGAFAIARAGRSMWITSFAGADVRRYDLP